MAVTGVIKMQTFVRDGLLPKMIKAGGVIFVLLIILLSLIKESTAMTKEYRYFIDLGAPEAYEVLFDFDSNYLTNQQGDILLPFAVFGGSPCRRWGMGQQATSLSERNPLPAGIKVRWFSVTENQFWEGECLFNQQLLENLTHYTVDNLLYRKKDKFSDYMGITVYVVPEGLVTVWINGGYGAEQFLLA